MKGRRRLPVMKCARRYELSWPIPLDAHAQCSQHPLVGEHAPPADLQLGSLEGQLPCTIRQASSVVVQPRLTDVTPAQRDAHQQA
jgi:hypothetical protein